MTTILNTSRNFKTCWLCHTTILMVRSLSSANVGDNFGSFHGLTTTAHFERRGVAFASWYMSVPIKTFC